MSKMIIAGSYGPSDPTRASMPFHVAKGAREAGYEVGIVLANDAPFLMKDTVCEAVLGVGMPPLKELFQFAVSNNVHVYI
ncbi:MAG TPA: DsrE family protein [Bryobacteraceae bacterium]|nr:DsrE family protein [Bryobacteraceae bacterium]